MLRIAAQSLRARWRSVTGAFIAILLAVTLGYASGLLMTSALSDPGAGRFAAAAAVAQGDGTVALESDDEVAELTSAPTLPRADVARAAAVPGVARAIGDVAVPAGAVDGHGDPLDGPGVDRLVVHGWSSAALAPYELSAGHAPTGDHDVVADAALGLAPGASIRLTSPGGEGDFRVTGIARSAVDDTGQGALFLTDAAAAGLSGAPGRINAVAVLARPGASPAALRAGLRDALGTEVDVRGHGTATLADAGGPGSVDREALVPIFGTMGGLSGAVALVVIAGTFGVVVAQRRKEMAVLRALGATGHQVRRLLAAEALIIAVVADALGLLAGPALSGLIAGLMADHGATPRDFGPTASWIPLVAAFGGGIVIAQLAVVAAAWRAGRVPPADALREAAIEHPRPGALRVVAGLVALGGGLTLAMVFSGTYAIAFAILASLLLVMGTGLLGPWLLGIPAALLALPGRLMGAPALLASAGLAANRWRSAALAAPALSLIHI